MRTTLFCLFFLSFRQLFSFDCSVFVLLKGASKQEAFHLGREIASTITAMNPAPMKLQLEKIYMPCIMVSKKRCVPLFAMSLAPSQGPFKVRVMCVYTGLGD
mgnify:FL=1